MDEKDVILKTEKNFHHHHYHLLREKQEDTFFFMKKSFHVSRKQVFFTLTIFLKQKAVKSLQRVTSILPLSLSTTV